MIDQLSIVDRVGKEVEESFLKMSFSLAKVDAISVFFYFGFWQGVVQQFKQSDKKEQNLFNI